jgi:hypothetical protein
VRGAGPGAAALGVHQGCAHTPLPPLGSTFDRQCNQCIGSRFGEDSPNNSPKPTCRAYKRRGRAPSQHTHHFGATTSFHTCTLLFLSSIWSLAKLVRGLDILATLGMRNTNSSNMFLSSTYHYSFAIELEYSSCVLMLAYELAYSFYVMNLAHRTLCLIIHTTYMIRIRAKLRWWFIVPSGFPCPMLVDP